MKRTATHTLKTTSVATAILLGVALGAQTSAQAATQATTEIAATTMSPPAHHARKRVARPSSPGVVTYDRDSKDPNVGWHSKGGMRVCTQDCDNPEIPGSGYTCRNVTMLGMAMRECDWSSW